MKYSIVEIFRSIQGEGLDVGVECVFVRFAGCNRDCVWCFTESTEIATPNGVRKIKDIKIGDKVFSYDGKNIVEDEVTNTFKRKADREEMLRITHERPNGAKSILKTYVTENHRFYVKGEWVEAKDLRIGDEIYSFDYRQWKMVNDNPMSNPEVAKRMGDTVRGRPSYERTMEHRLKQREMKLGEKNPRYKGGHRPGYLKLWGKTRKEALERDKYTCQECGSTERLEVHHIIPYLESEDDSLENLVTLCKTCHLRVENELIFHNGVKVLGIERLSERQMARWGNKDTVDVYNFETKNHNYIANSMLVHNCDTDWKKGQALSLEEVIAEIEKYDCRYVVLTGGEPTIQKGLPELVTALTELEYDIAIETNGTVFVPDLSVHMIAISPKLSSSGRAFEEYTELKSLVESYPAFLKFVVSGEEDMEEAKEITEYLYNETGAVIEVVFQPVFGEIEVNELPKLFRKVYGEVGKTMLVRFLPQVHKLIGVR